MPGERRYDSLEQAEDACRRTGIRAVIFDVDGTLYHQRPVRLRMAARMAGYYGTRPRRLSELKGILAFRKLREEEAYQTVSQEDQIREAARRAGIPDASALEKAIQHWMFSAPLREIAAHPKKEVISFLRRMQAEGRKIIIYSDYAAEEKLKALQLEPDAVYYPGTAGMRELKPSRESMNLILSREGLRPDQAMMVGDREEKDGRSAELAGMPFVIVE